MPSTKKNKKKMDPPLIREGHLTPKQVDLMREKIKIKSMNY